jgi:DNA-binding beta-propeller fold protein YncE
VKTFTIIGKVGLMHPTGITAYGDTLFVAEQQSNVVIAFNITSERYIRTIIPRITDPVEQIILSNC